MRGLGIAPTSAKAKEVLGVVVEVAVSGGLDVVAAWADHGARFYNYSGTGVVWERAGDALNADIDDLLKKAEILVCKIGPWNKPRPPAPPQGQARINILTPSGLHFGQGPYDALSKDALGGPLLGAAFNLMQELIALTKKD